MKELNNRMSKKQSDPIIDRLNILIKITMAMIDNAEKL